MPGGLHAFLDFEAPIAELEGQIEELRHRAADDGTDVSGEVTLRQQRIERDLKALYDKLTPWQTVQVARHPSRPGAAGFVDGLVADLTPLAGDRAVADDTSVIAGLGRIQGFSAIVLGVGSRSALTGQGRSGEQRPNAAGYRKVARLIRLAGRFHLPVVAFVAMPRGDFGSYAGGDARGAAIGDAIDAVLNATVPVVAVIVGEAIGPAAVPFACGDRVLMLSHAVFAAATPEAAARGLWGDAEQVRVATEALRMTAPELRDIGLVDGIVPEPVGGAHRHPEATIAATGQAIEDALRALIDEPIGPLRVRRRERLLALGAPDGA